MTEYKLLHVLRRNVLKDCQSTGDRLLLFEELEMESEHPSYVCVIISKSNFVSVQIYIVKL